ncbi:helix-turn-helix transcriptional regulator [Actinophytocola gossypii]|uniref:helix-turn-helix transcriptional regulator n=1 Tax=Actinophytocola gossypii TaxID=2812003 RepID=UPI0021A7F601|nr:response regulator transcription factor [Actinophytocola gossypii]
MDPLIHAGMRSELRDKPGIELVDDLGDAEVVVAVGVSALRDLPESSSRRLVLVASEPRQADLWTAIGCGLAVLVPEHEATTLRLLRAIGDARRGHGDLPPEHLGTLLRGLSQLHRDVLAPRQLTFTGLSSREADVLRHIADGLDTGQIARELSYSEQTVKNILQGLLSRLGLRNRSHAIAYAIRLGLI